MEILLVVLVVIVFPFAAVAALTDAIHRDLGPVVSPWVTRRAGRWRVSVAVPFDRPALVQAVVAVARRAFPERFELVLTPRERTAS